MMTDELHWHTTTFSRFARLAKGMSYKSEDYCENDNGNPFVTLKCISKGGGFKRKGIKFVRAAIPEKFRLKQGDVVIANTDLTRDGDVVGCPAVVPELPGATEIGMSMDLSRVDMTTAEVDKRFVFYALATPRVRKFMQDNSSGSTVLHLRTSNIGALDFWMPADKHEQSKIADILSIVDRAFELTDSLITKHERIKQGLMRDLLTRGIDEKGNIRSEKTHKFKDSPLGRIPEEWDAVELEALRRAITSGSRGWAAYYSDDGPLFLRIGNLTRDHIDLRLDDLIHVEPPTGGEGSRTRVEEGDVLVSITADLGIIGVAPGDMGEAYVNQHIALVKLDRSKANPRWIGYYLAGEQGQKQFYRLNDPGAKAGLNLPTVGRLLVALPSAQEQEEIVAIADAHVSNIHAEEAYRDKLKRLKKGLMDDLLTGKVRINHLLTQ